jgi:iron complex outermembrane recepter protein
MRLSIAIAAVCLSIIGLSRADPVRASMIRKPTHIPAEALSTALQTLANDRNFQVIYVSEEVNKLRTPGAVGEFTSDEALKQLLRGTGMTYRYLDKKTVTILTASAIGVGITSASTVAPTSSPISDNAQKPGDEEQSLWDRFRVAQLDQANGSSAPYVAAAGRAAQETSEEPARLQEVLVTARKVSERLQDVPMAITALQGETLEETGAVTLQDIGREVPGLSVVTAAPGQNQLIMRGISGGSTIGGTTVGFYIDEVPLVGLLVSGMDPVLNDLDRVEILRGPQGTLYGASSLGGTVKYVTNQPNLDAAQESVKMTLSDTQGGGWNTEVDGIVNQPIAEGSAGLRLVGFYRDYDGYLDRYQTDPNNYLAVLPGPSFRDVNTERTYGGRLSAEVKLGDTFTVVPSVLLQRTDLGGTFTFDDPPGSFDNPIQSRLLSEPSSDLATLYTLTAKGDLGLVHITSATGYFDREVAVTEDASKQLYYFFSPQPQTYVYPSPIYAGETTHNFTEELRANASAGPLHLLAGVFYSHVDGAVFGIWPTPAGYAQAFGNPFGGDPMIYAGVLHLIDRQRALFAELNFDVTQQLQLTVGARVFHQDQAEYFPQSGVFNGGVANLFTAASKASGTTPKYALSYHVTPDILTYASAANGFREGGEVGLLPNACDADLAALGLTSSPTKFGPDTVWSYEVGAKTDWLNHTLTVNSALYYIDWRDIQQTISLVDCGYAFTGNFGTAVSKGAELELQYQPASGLQLGLEGAFNQAQLTSTVAGAQGQVGNTLENSPKWNGAASIEYRRQFAPDLSGFARFDINATSHEYNSFVYTSIYSKDAGYSLANIRFGVRRSRWQSSLFVLNLFDKHAETALPISNAADLPTQRRFSLNRPRTVGLDVRVQF